jgi:simple sugar transport system permease protein
VLELIEALRYSAPVGIAAAGESAGQRAGALNIGLEGTMLMAAFASVQASQAAGPWAGLAAGIAAGLLTSLLQAAFVLALAADQVVVGAAVNLLALGLTNTLFQRIYGAGGALISAPKLPQFGPGLDAGLIILVAGSAGLAWMVFRSRWGLALRAAGESPKAAEAAGRPVLRLRLQAMLIAGAMAGAAGAYLGIGIAGSFSQNMTAGRGFVALAMVTFGRWKPILAVSASLLVGLAETLQFRLQALGLGWPPQAFTALPYAFALGVLILVGRSSRAPAALGTPYRRAR